MISPPDRHGENNCSALVKISSDVVEISSEPVKISSELVEISSELVLKETEKISTSAESLIISIFRKTTNAVCPSLLSRYSQPPNAANVGSSWAVYGSVCMTFFNIHFPCVLHPIFRVFVCARCFECLFAPDISPDLRPCVSGGVAPIPTFCPYRARYLLNPVHGGTQGVVHSVHYTLG